MQKCDFYKFAFELFPVYFSTQWVFSCEFAAFCSLTPFTRILLEGASKSSSKVLRKKTNLLLHSVVTKTRNQK